MNTMAVRALHYYASVEGPHRTSASKIYQELRCVLGEPLASIELEGIWDLGVTIILLLIVLFVYVGLILLEICIHNI